MKIEDFEEKLRENEVSKNQSFTIYRNLDVLESLNLIHKITVNDENSLFGLVLLDNHHKLELYGFCEECQKAKE